MRGQVNEAVPSFDIDDYPNAASLGFFGWPYEKLPDFMELKSETDLRPMPRTIAAATTRHTDTLLVLIAALAKECGIDVSARGAAARIRGATELLGAHVSEDTIKNRVLGAIPDALEKRSKSA